MAGMATHKSGLPISPHGDPGELSKPQSAPPGRRAWIALSMLIVVYVLNFLSRQLPGILAKPIQDSLHLSDGQLGRILSLIHIFLDDVRCNLASEYLRSTRLSIEDISELVGFSEAANFRHAFHRWTGSTPARYRS